MSDKTGSGDWFDRKPKCKGIYNVLHHLVKSPKEGLACVGKDDDAKNLFNAHSGGLIVPDGARVIFFGPNEGEIYSGDGRLSVGSSVIIRVPSEKVSSKLTDVELMNLCILGNYPYWPPDSTENFELSTSLR